MGRIQRDTGSEVRGNRSVPCGIEGASAEYLLVWAVPFTKQVDQVERTQRQVKIITKGLENVTYKDRSEALGIIKKESSQCLSSGGDCCQDEHAHLAVVDGTLASVAAVKADLDETSGNTFECQG